MSEITIRPAQIERLARLLVGEGPGWQSRFSRLTGLSTGHLSNLLSGSRGITSVATQQIVDAARKEAAAMQTRAAEIDTIIDLLLETPIEIEN